MRDGIDFSHVQTETPVTSQGWLSIKPEEQLTICQKLLNDQNCDMDVVSTNSRGEVIVQFRKLLGSSERGTALLDAENILKSYDSALTIYLHAKNDLNPLRKFRGVVINDDRS